MGILVIRGKKSLKYDRLSGWHIFCALEYIRAQGGTLPRSIYSVLSVAALLFDVGFDSTGTVSFLTASILDQDVWSANTRLVFYSRTVVQCTCVRAAC